MIYIVQELLPKCSNISCLQAGRYFAWHVVYSSYQCSVSTFGTSLVSFPFGSLIISMVSAISAPSCPEQRILYFIYISQPSQTVQFLVYQSKKINSIPCSSFLRCLLLIMCFTASFFPINPVLHITHVLTSILATWDKHGF